MVPGLGSPDGRPFKSGQVHMCSEDFLFLPLFSVHVVFEPSSTSTQGASRCVRVQMIDVCMYVNVSSFPSQTYYNTRIEFTAIHHSFSDTVASMWVADQCISRETYF
jgi:hypothetical protein